MNESIYSTVPQLKEVSQEKKDFLINLLRNNPGKFYTARKLAIECDFPKFGTNVEIRKCIKEFVSDGIPIVSTIKGFSYIDRNTDAGKNMIRFNIRNFEQRVQGIQRSINDLRALL